RVGDLAALRRSDLLALRYTQGLPPGELPPGRDRAGSGLPSRARVGQSDGAVERGEVSQDRGLSEQPGEPAGADQQSRGADQPDGAVLGEGTVQVAAAQDAGPFRDLAARCHLESWGSRPGRAREITPDPPTASDTSSDQARISSSRVRMWWCSARSVRFPGIRLSSDQVSEVQHVGMSPPLLPTSGSACPPSPWVRLSRTRTTMRTPSPWGSRPTGDLEFP